jgi:hypothetical protein
MYKYVYVGWIEVIGISEETFGLLLSAKHMSQLNVQEHIAIITALQTCALL